MMRPTLTNRRSWSDALRALLRPPKSPGWNHPTPLAKVPQAPSYDFALKTPSGAFSRERPSPRMLASTMPPHALRRRVRASAICQGDVAHRYGVVMLRSDLSINLRSRARRDVKA